MKLLLAGWLFASIAFCDAVTDWNAVMCTAIRAEGAHVQARYAAITHLAMFDAVNSITRQYRPYLQAIPAAPSASAEAAAVAAAHRVLTTYLPANVATLNMERSKSLAEIPDGPNKMAGIAVGEAAAAALLSNRANDGSGMPVPYTPPVGTGYWQPTPPAFAPSATAHWGKVRPFGMLTGDQFRTDPPPALNSRVYARDYNEIKRMGGVDSPARPQDRTDLARYMSLTSPTQIVNYVAVQLSAADDLTLSENARMFALMNMAVADASIAVFDSKFTYHFWRPVTAIRAGDTDGNPRTEAEPGFTPLINAPAYPSHPSGYGGFCNAARVVLEHFFGKRGHSFLLEPIPAVPNMRLQYTSLRQLTEDVSDARVFGGIHFRFEQDDAEDLGEQVGRYIVRHHLRPDCPGRCADQR